MSKLSSSTILNIGSLATFVAFPILYSATYSGNTAFIAIGVALMLFSMATPFIAKGTAKKQ